MKRLDNVVQHYAWGDPVSIPALLGLANAEARPYAELWMGTHDFGPSRIFGEDATLLQLLGDPLPFLMKVLAAARPLSIQAHPNKQAAEKGYHEQRQLPESERNYHDTNHKPELIYALEDFHALSGFREEAAVLADLESLHLLPKVISANALPACFAQWFSRTQIDDLLPALRQKAGSLVAEKGDRFWWALEIERVFPGDTGILGPIFLNLVHLSPGQALFQAPGTLHAYLRGSGIEVMASSDNVLRCAATKKRIDLSALLSIISFDSQPSPLIDPHIPIEGVAVFMVPVDDFCLIRICPGMQSLYLKKSLHPAVLFCQKGRVGLQHNNIFLNTGQSLILEARDEVIEMQGEGILFLASHGSMSSQFSR